MNGSRPTTPPRPRDRHAWLMSPDRETHWLGELAAHPVPVRLSLRGGAEPTAVRLALRQGVTNEERLTALVFHGRHPERAGRPIGRDQPALVREWATIRDHVVRPVLTAGTFGLVPVETPGGGRIRDKRHPGGGDMVTVRGVNAPVRAHRLAARAWAAMVRAARADGIAEPLLLPTSGYRSSATQARLFEQAVARYGSREKARRWVAPPGGSAHHSGRGFDLYLGGRIDSANVPSLRRLPAHLWLVANAARFGFYSDEAEPWHWEYNPPARGELEAEAEAGTPMVSPLAVPGGAMTRRPDARTLPVYGVCVHTTADGPARKANAARTTPLQLAIRTYLEGGVGPHYVIGYDGTIVSTCDEGHIAWHAGWGGKGKTLWPGWKAPAWWISVWRKWNASTPLDLLPRGASDPNQVYIGVELLADKTGYGFTPAQYEALAQLVLDVARRHNVTINAAPSPRLLGHEDVDPIQRGRADGGRDPGAHRPNPKFSWADLWSRMRALPATGSRLLPAPAGPPGAAAGTVTAFADLLRRAFGAGSPGASVVGVAEAAGAFAAGERNANRLTDIVFNARYRSRGGRLIGPDERRLGEEWRQIRDNLVQPALRAAARAPAPAVAAPAPAVTAPPGTPSATHFRRRARDPHRFALLTPLLERYRKEIPLKFLLGWIGVESDGCIDEITGLDERGFFQVHPGESELLKFDHKRLSTDVDYSVWAGIQLARFYANYGRKFYTWAAPGSELFWRIVKLQHAMGIGAAKLLFSDMRKHNVPMTWEAIKRYEVTQGPRIHPLLDPARSGEPAGRFGANVDDVFTWPQKSQRRGGR